MLSVRWLPAEVHWLFTGAEGHERTKGYEGGQAKQAIQTPPQRLGSVPNLERQASTSSGPKFSGTKLFKEAT